MNGGGGYTVCPSVHIHSEHYVVIKLLRLLDYSRQCGRHQWWHVKTLILQIIEKQTLDIAGGLVDHTYYGEYVLHFTGNSVCIVLQLCINSF